MADRGPAPYIHADNGGIAVGGDVHVYRPPSPCPACRQRLLIEDERVCAPCAQRAKIDDLKAKCCAAFLVWIVLLGMVIELGQRIGIASANQFGWAASVATSLLLIGFLAWVWLTKR